MAGDHSVNSQKAKRRRAIDQHEIEGESVNSRLAQSIIQQKASLFVGDKLHICGRQVCVCRANEETGDLGFLDDQIKRGFIHNQVICGVFPLISINP